MPHIYTSAEIREIDRHAADELFVPTASLMENAGRSIAEVVKAEWNKRERKILVFCGKGNNGGDGYVVARHLHSWGVEVETVSLVTVDELKGAAQANSKATQACRIKDWHGEVPRHMHPSRLIIVDAIFGTGLTRPPEGAALDLIRLILEAHSQGALVVAGDVPSGVNADSPLVPGESVRADITVALHGLKPAHVQHPARGFCGEIRVASIGIPERALVPKRRWLDAVTLPRRGIDAHKGTAGHVLVVAGSPGKSGASFMSCAAALRSGAGLVTLASAESVIGSVLPQLPEAMGHALASITVDGLSTALERKNALVIGPGIARDENTGLTIATVLRTIDIPVIIDADGLNALAQSPQALAELAHAKRRPVLTPHPTELARLLGCTTEDVQRDRLAAASQAATRFQAHVVLKGACSVIAHPDGTLAVNSTGNAAMASAGMGDVLSGVVGALLAQRIDPGQAAEIATYVHGRAGDLAAVGDRGLIAGDVIAKLPAAFAEVTGTCR